ncbi:unnamed protein product [Lepeophtheirus salmonis]|uniref:(salmon louse) hypothetical protein n=1 Tax=Lepeophtheirus salmonis TaxID=72036 RepID=A0A7R8H750_LEPSM|nr:unnamed protein product [Lepeophtheirus salmonis]CAF2895368.1 unnamed protein product [Lepeophtheirus salmonis]
MVPDGNNRKKSSFVKVFGGGKVPTYGEVSLDVKFYDSKSRILNFICTAVNKPILGFRSCVDLVIAAAKSDDWSCVQDEGLRSKRNALSVKNGLLFWGIRFAVPKKLRAKFLQQLHINHAAMESPCVKDNNKTPMAKNVWCQNFNNRKPTWLEGKILDKTGNVLFKVQVDGKIVIRHINQLRPHRSG